MLTSGTNPSGLGFHPGGCPLSHIGPPFSPFSLRFMSESYSFYRIDAVFGSLNLKEYKIDMIDYLCQSSFLVDDLGCFHVNLIV